MNNNDLKKEYENVKQEIIKLKLKKLDILNEMRKNE